MVRGVGETNCKGVWEMCFLVSLKEVLEVSEYALGWNLVIVPPK